MTTKNLFSLLLFVFIFNVLIYAVINGNYISKLLQANEDEPKTNNSTQTQNDNKPEKDDELYEKILTLIEKFESKDKEIRDNAIEKLIQIGDIAVPYLFKEFKKELTSDSYNYLKRLFLIQVLGQISKDDEIALEIAKCLDDDIYFIRMMAVYMLGFMGNKCVLPVLIKAYEKEENTDIRSMYIHAFVQLSAYEMIPLIIDVAKKDENKFVRSSAILAFKNFVNKLMMLIIDGLNDKDNMVRRDSIFSMIELEYTIMNCFRQFIDIAKNDDDLQLREVAMDALKSFKSTKDTLAYFEEQAGLPEVDDDD